MYRRRCTTDPEPNDTANGDGNTVAAAVDYGPEPALDLGINHILILIF